MIDRVASVSVVSPYLGLAVPPASGTAAPTDTACIAGDPQAAADVTNVPDKRKKILALAAMGILVATGVAVGVGQGMVPSISIDLANRSLPNRMVGTTVDRDLARKMGISNQVLFARLKAMGFNTVRIGAYWDEIQPHGPNDADFAEVDSEIQAAHQAGLSVVLTVGAKAPSWPEYHVPAWAAPHPVQSAGVSPACIDCS